MTEQSSIFFPLRSNAKSLLAGAPAQGVVARLKLASLLYDHVLVEDGEYRIQGGPGGSSRFWMPPEESPRSWQLPSERSRGQSSEFTLSMKPADASADAPAMVILDSPAVVSWRATFEPIKKDLTSAHDWFVFGHADDPRDSGHALARMERALGNHPEVQALLPDHFVPSCAHVTMPPALPRTEGRPGSGSGSGPQDRPRQRPAGPRAAGRSWVRYRPMEEVASASPAARLRESLCDVGSVGKGLPCAQ